MTSVVATTKTLIVNEKNQLLLLKIGLHTQQPERSHTWDLPGGFIDEGESEVEGAVREIKEETGIDVNPDEVNLLYGTTGYYKERDKSVTHLCYGIVFDKTPQITISWEHASYEWVDFATVLQNYELLPRYRKFIEYAQEHELLIRRD